MYKWAKPLSLFSRIVVRKNVFKSFKALNDRLFVAVMTGIVANICSNFNINGQVPIGKAMPEHSIWTISRRRLS